MLRKLKIERFKSIYSADLDFGCANIFVGPNGAGKSNVLEAIGILASALSRGIDQNALDLRGVRLSLPRLFKSAFKNYKLPQTFHMVAEFENGKYECSIRSGISSPYLEFHTEALYDGGSMVFGRSPRGARVYGQNEALNNIDLSAIETNRSIWDVLGSVLRISDEFHSEIAEFSNFAIYAPQTAVMRGLAIDSRVMEPLGLTGSGLAQAFQHVLAMRAASDIVRKRIDETLGIIWKPGWADTIRVKPFDPDIVPPQVRSEGSLIYIRDKFMNLTRNFLSPFDASEGTLYLIFVATLLAHSDAPKVFALDNVDGTLNPDLVRQLTDHIVRISCDVSSEANLRQQVFMTSHHPSALDSFDLFNEKHRVFTVNRSDAKASPLGSTAFKPIRAPSGMSKDEWILAHKGKNLSQLLLEGRIPGALF
ncbi:ATP-binding protein [Caulobacter sp. BK020]|uniref:AAA family ATPase n=1 Tax=Caulobacter sp. BK020 TaxID=2512117 RepID=UPI00104FE270|nr:ATP-binding protein [Caulobacter sp. BK020]TCS10354.1 putative ATPase [Caulobacter sp. BK020]